MLFGVVVNSINFAIFRPFRSDKRDNSRSEQGFVLVFASITMLVMTALGGFRGRPRAVVLAC